MRKDLEEAERSRVGEFTEWFEASGGRLHPSLEYAQDDLMGLSIYSTADLATDAVAIAVPREICITASSAARSIVRLFSQAGGVGEDVREEKDEEAMLLLFSGKEWVIFYLFLHKLRHKIDRRGWEASHDVIEDEQKRKRQKLNENDVLPAKHLRHEQYIRLLPEETVTPLHFNKGEVRMLRSTPLFGHAIESRKNGRKSFLRAMNWLQTHLRSAKGYTDRWAKDVLDHLDTPPDEEEEEDKGNLEQELSEWGEDEKKYSLLGLWRWCETAYGSRAFPPRVIGETQESSLSAPVLIPGLDSFNHSRGAKVTWTWNDQPTEHVTLTLHNAYPKDEQAFNTYGPKSNEELLASYGFVNERCEDDTLTLKLGGFEELPVQQYYWKDKEPCPPGLLDALHIAFRMQCGETLATIEEDKDLPEDDYDTMMGKVNIADHLLDLLKAKQASFDASQAMADSAMKADPSIRAMVASNVDVYRKSQARILSHAIKWTETYSEERVKSMAETLGCTVEELFTTDLLDHE